MKARNFIKSMVFLFAILFSFSVNAYNSLKQCENSSLISHEKTNVNIPFEANLVAESLISEEVENENDNEDFLSESFLVLPFSILAFNAFENSKPYRPSKVLSRAAESIFLSVRAILI